MAHLRIPQRPGGAYRLASTVLFDLDGVLVESFDVWVAVLNRCRQARDLPPLPIESIRASWGQGIVADCATFFVGTEPQELAAEYDRFFVEEAGRVEAIPGAVESVRHLSEAGLCLALVTNTPQRIARRLLEGIGIEECFPVVAGGDEVSHPKPAPDLVTLALDRLGRSPEEAVFVGDTRNDLLAGRAAGVPVIGYRMDADHRMDSLHLLCEWIEH